MSKGHNHQTIKAFARIEKAIKKILRDGKRGKKEGIAPESSVAQNPVQNLVQKLTYKRVCKAAKCSDHTLKKYWELQAGLRKSREALSSLGQYTDIPDVAPNVAPGIAPGDTPEPNLALKNLSPSPNLRGVDKKSQKPLNDQWTPIFLPSEGDTQTLLRDSQAADEKLRRLLRGETPEELPKKQREYGMI